MHGEDYQYGMWMLVILNSVIFIFFAFSFVKPKTKTDWRSLGAFSAFIVALFTEMYGFPLTIYLLSGWLTEQFPGMNIYAHEAGHLWNTIFGWEINAHFDPFHIISMVFIVAGFFMLSSAWRILHEAQKAGTLARGGWYERCRHPQYVAFMVIMFGFLLQWPTIPTIVMFPIMVMVYIRLARYEEKLSLEEFGDEYRQYMQAVPAFIPTRLLGRSHVTNH